MLTDQNAYNEIIDILVEESSGYYRGLKSLSDGEFDALHMLAKRYEKDHPEHMRKDSPSKTVGTMMVGKDKVRHPVRMWSLANVYNFDELNKFIRRSKIKWFVIENKYDGLSVDLIYVNGKFTSALTRGDGIYGKDITEGVRQIPDLPMTINTHLNCLSFHIEVLISKENLQLVNTFGGKVYSNCRNAAAGIVQAGGKLCEHLTYRLFEVNSTLASHVATTRCFHVADAWGFLYDEGSEVEAKDVVDWIEKWSGKDRRDKLPIEIDGLVIKALYNPDRERLLYTTKAPKWAVAWKFAPDSIETVLEDVKFQVSGSGNVNPVAVLKPVKLGGVEVSSANLHNLSVMRLLGMMIGDTVVVARVADVNNQILEVVKEKRPLDASPIAIPTRCPSCSELLEDSELKPVLRCTNIEGCREQVIARLKKYLSPDGLGIKISKTTLDNLFSLGVVTAIPDLFDVTVDDLVKARMSETSAQEFRDAIIASIDLDPVTHLAVLGIPGISYAAAADIIEHYGSFNLMVTNLIVEDDDLKELSPALVEYFNLPYGRRTLVSMSYLLR